MSSPTAPKPAGPDHNFHPVDRDLLIEVHGMRSRLIKRIETETLDEFKKLFNHSGKARHDKISARHTQAGPEGHWEAADTENRGKADAVTAGASDAVIDGQMGKYLSAVGKFPVTITGTGVIEDQNASIDYTKNTSFWSSKKTVDDIYNEIKGKDAGVLRGWGIVLRNSLGAETMAGATLSDPESKKLAEQLFVPFVAHQLSAGNVSRMNVAMALTMLKEDPSILEVLRAKEGKDDQKNRKDKLRLDVQKLEGIKISAKSYKKLRKEYSDLKTIADTDADYRKRQEANSKMEKVREELEEYVTLKRQLEEIYRQFDRITGLDKPAGGTTFMTLAGTGTVDIKLLTAEHTPQKILGELDDYLKIKMPEAAKDAVEEGPVRGPAAITRVFETYIDRHTPIGPEKSREAAVLAIYENQKTPALMHEIEHDVQALVGKRSMFRSLRNEIGSYLKGFSSGSDEAVICRIAETQHGITPSAGTVERNPIHQTFKWGVLPAAALMTFAGLSWPVAVPIGAATAAASFAARRLLPGIPETMDKLFGTRMLGILPWARHHARPAWGEIAEDVVALRAVWDQLRAAKQSGELSNTPYVQRQLEEVRFYLASAENYQRSITLARMDAAKIEKGFGTEDIHSSLVKREKTVTKYGYSDGPQADGLAPQVAEMIEHIKHDKNAVGAKRRALKKAPGGFWNWLNTEQ